MHRLRCGVIYTNAFAEHLAELHTCSEAGTVRKILALEYVRASSGDQKGGAWWDVQWVPEKRVPVECRFEIGSVPVCLSRQSQQGLKNRCLDWRDGAVVVQG